MLLMPLLTLLLFVIFVVALVTLRVIIIANTDSPTILTLRTTKVPQLVVKFVHIVGRQVIQLKFAIGSMAILLVIASLMPNPPLLTVYQSLKEKLLKRKHIPVLRVQKFGLLLNNTKLYWP